MNIFVAGATGALGRILVPQLVARGHSVTGMTRSRSKTDLVRRLGAVPVVADALDPDAVGRAVGESVPEVVVHQLTALSGSLDRRFDRMLAQTNRLRTEGTDHLLAAARAAGVERFVAQSYAGSGAPFERTGGWIKTEEDPIDPEPPKQMQGVYDAIRHLEQAVVEAHGAALRYGSFYGPGTSIGLDSEGQYIALIRKRRMPIVGGGTGIWSFIHLADAAAATVAAIERDARGVFNIVDDDPAPMAEWLPVLAEAVGAPPPRRVPRWVGRLAAGSTLTTIMTEGRGASNAKAKRELGWAPRYASWRTGFREGLIKPTAHPA